MYCSTVRRVWRWRRGRGRPACSTSASSSNERLTWRSTGVRCSGSSGDTKNRIGRAPVPRTCSSAGLDLRNEGGRDLLQQRGLLAPPVPWVIVDDAQRAGRLAVGAEQRDPCVGDHLEVADRSVVAQRRVLAG